ncbi:hypothetical protein [Ornithinimicrobium kibberense]|uniref:hypothetical protein n=1 Tax=Ornithinimicrobium kibberense TaxID=282060 RepID=UPI0036097FD5
MGASSRAPRPVQEHHGGRHEDAGQAEQQQGPGGPADLQRGQRHQPGRHDQRGDATEVRAALRSRVEHDGGGAERQHHGRGGPSRPRGPFRWRGPGRSRAGPEVGPRPHDGRREHQVGTEHDPEPHVALPVEPPGGHRLQPQHGDESQPGRPQHVDPDHREGDRGQHGGGTQRVAPPRPDPRQEGQQADGRQHHDAQREDGAGGRPPWHQPGEEGGHRE